MTQQTFVLKLRLPEQWNITPETLKKMIEEKTIFTVDEIEDFAKKKKPATLEQIITLWEMLKLHFANENHPEFGVAVYEYITKEAAMWNLENIAHRSFYNKKAMP